MSASDLLTGEGQASSFGVGPGSRATTRRPRGMKLRVAHWVILGNLLVAAVLMLGTVLTLHGSRAEELDRVREAADNLAHSLSIEVASELGLVDNALTTIATRYAGATEAERNAQLQQSMREQERLLPFISGLRAADATGRVLLGLPGGTAPFSIQGREYFSAARREGATVVSEPIYSRALNDWCLIVARPLQGERGEFQGVVYAVLAAQHFRTLFGRMSIGDDGAIALRSTTLRMLARHAPAATASMQDPSSADAPSELLQALDRDAERGWFVARSAFDGVERVTAYRRVPGRPFMVLADLGTGTQLARWEAEKTRQWLFAATIMLMVLSGFVYMILQHRRQATERAQALRVAREQALLLDNDLVGMVRVEGRRILWANRALHRILGHPDTSLAGQSMRLLYPDDATFERVGQLGYEALRRDGRFHAQLQMRSRDGKDLWVDLSAAATGGTEFLWMVVDIDQLKHSEQDAQHMALHDALTGLANRRLFEELLRQASAQARRQQQGLTVCYMDLDGFKPINDTHGHDAGDAVLREIGARLRHELRDNDSVARLGGDEFAWLLAGVGTEEEARAIVDRCIEKIRQPIQLTDGGTVKVGASVGLACSAVHGHSPQRLLLAADEAMYLVKRSARPTGPARAEGPAQRAQSPASLPTVMTACSISVDQGTL